MTVNSFSYFNGRTDLEIITSETLDVSEYLDFGLSFCITYQNNDGLGLPEIARWIGVSHQVWKLIFCWILDKSGIPLFCTTVQRITNTVKQTDEYKERIKYFGENLKNKYAIKSNYLKDTRKDIPQRRRLCLKDKDEEFKDDFHWVINSKDLKNIDDKALDDNESVDAVKRNVERTRETSDVTEIGNIDPYLGMELGLNKGDEEGLHSATVKKRAVDEDGKPIVKPSNNPILDSRQYEVEYADGNTEVMAANVIAEKFMAQTDDNGNRHLLIYDIEDHRTTEEAIQSAQVTYNTKSGFDRKKKTTKGWELYVKWRDGSRDCVAMKDLNDSYPAPLADYAISNILQDEPVFACWIPYNLKKRIAVISMIKSK